MYVAQVQQVSLLVIKYTIANSSWPLRNGLCLRASEGLAGLLLEHKLLHLAARRQREPVDDAEELGHLEMRQLAPTQRLDGLDDGLREMSWTCLGRYLDMSRPNRQRLAATSHCSAPPSATGVLSTTQAQTCSRVG